VVRSKFQNGGEMFPLLDDTPARWHSNDKAIPLPAHETQVSFTVSSLAHPGMKLPKGVGQARADKTCVL
jgi:hypothetical protein